jgi:SAM-dependent methyltransferase
MASPELYGDHDYKETVRREWTAAAAGWRKWYPTQEADAAGRAVTRVLLQQAGLQMGDVVLDVGSGYGEPGLSAAALVGADGHVTCIDISGDMLAFAEERARNAALTNVSFLEADVEDADLEPGHYDAVVSRAALMYATDPVETLRRLRGALRSGGRISVGVWATPDKVAFATPVPIMAEMLGLDLPSGGPGPFALGQPGALANLVAQAGFGEVATGTALAIYEVADPETCTQYLRDCAPPIVDLIADQPVAVQEGVWRRVTEAWTAYQGNDGRVRLPCTAVWASGTNPRVGIGRADEPPSE